MSRLYAIGELLIDFQSVGTGGLKETEQFVKKAGGAPANVCAQAAKLGADAVYLTKVGDDGFGEFLIDALQESGIDTRYVKKDGKRHTSLAFVSLREDGEREFSFYRTDAADLALDEDEFKGVEFQPNDILEFGSVALASERSRKAHMALIKRARNSGAIVAFDPNLRFNLWEDKGELRRRVLEFAEYADVIKVGLDELEWITGENGEMAVQALRKGRDMALLVTNGSHGATLYACGTRFDCQGHKVQAVDTTGAGDSFFGAFLASLLLNGIGKDDLQHREADYPRILDLACKAGAYTTTGYGAIPSMGNLEQIERKVK